MSTDDIEERIRGVIADVFGLGPGDVGPETSSEAIEGWDSLQHLTLILALEDEFDVQLDDEETVAAVSFPAIVEIIREHLRLAEAR